jgi:hypothetical protein
MKDEAKSQLKKIVGDYDEKLAEAERVDAARRTALAAFPGRFVTLKKETIWPAIQEIADMLNERGHEASVGEQEGSSSTAGGVKSAAVWLRIVPKPFAHKSADQPDHHRDRILGQPQRTKGHRGVDQYDGRP